MLTGLDEHGQKVEQVAIKRGLTPQQHVDEIAKQAKDLWKLMDVQYNDFIRTTEERHTKIVEKIFDRFMEQGDIYKGEYEGWYCMPCETYFTETQLVDGKCPDCGREVKKMKEESYFFNMKKYQKRLEEFYEQNPDFIKPESRKNELFNNFIKPGLEDLCVTRTTFDWGIKVPKDPKHVIYVWLDALTNYITALGYMSDDDTLFKKYWPADLQIDGQDAIFTPEDFVNKYNFDLCNDLGNLLNRTIGMVNKYFGGNVPNYTGRINDVDADLEETVASKIAEYENNMEDLHFSNAIESIWGIISRANKYIDETAPWTLAKQEETEKLESVMSHLVETLRIVAILIKPAMTETSNKILSQLGINEEASKEYDTIKEFGKTTSDLKVIEKGEPIFLRLDANEEIEYIKNKMKE